MKEMLNHMLVGLSSIFFAPSGTLPAPPYRITLPPLSARQAVGMDFGWIAQDLRRAVDQQENIDQLELQLTSEQAKT